MKTSGSSLIEVIIAMIIIGMVFSASMVIYLQVLQSGTGYTKMLANFYIQDLVADAEVSGKFEEKQVECNEFITIFQTVTSRPNDVRLVEVRWEARDPKGKLLAERKMIFYAAP